MPPAADGAGHAAWPDSRRGTGPRRVPCFPSHTGVCMITADFSQQAALGYDRVPLVRRVLADLDTPLSIYLKLARGPYSYLLESVQGGERWGRYSFIGLPARSVIRVRGNHLQQETDGRVVESHPDCADPLAWIEDFQRRFRVAPLPGLPRFTGGLVGYFGYESVRYIEPRLGQRLAKPDPLGTPDILLMVSEEVLAFDNLSGELTVIVLADPSDTQDLARGEARLDDLVARLSNPLLPTRPLTPLATPEWKRPNLSSVYALTKYVQEQMTLNVTAAHGMEGVALRLFNAYGPGQALQNPYTGVLAIFASRLANGKPPLIYEDGAQRRDFVHVEDVARAFELALERPEADGEIFNIASGQERTVAHIAQMIAAAMDRPSLQPEITGKARSGDIRHCFADTTKAKQLLGFEAKRDFAAGLRELSEWVAGQDAQDRLTEARRELEARGLLA